MEKPADNRPVWDIDKTNPEFHNDLIEGLAGITDPELGYSIIDLGLVRNISLENDRIKLLMILTTPFCPYGPAMLESTRSQVEKITGKPTDIEFGTEVWDPTMMDPDLKGSNWGLFS